MNNMVISLLEHIFGDVKNVTPEMLEKVAVAYADSMAVKLILADRYIAALHQYNNSLEKVFWHNVAQHI